MTGFNLSDWALKHRSFIWFLMLISVVAGALSYSSIGREEDPSFAIKTMIVSAALPGADVQQTLSQVTERIEKKLSDLPELDFTRSVTRAGQATVYVELRANTKPDQLPRIWQTVRNMMADIRAEFPQNFAGFQFNDNFGDVFGNIYAFTSDGFTPREVQDYVQAAQRQIQGLEDAGKVEVFGTRDELIYLEFDTERLAALGLNQQAVQATLVAQNAIVPSGVIDAGPERVLVRVGGAFTGVQSLLDINLRVDGRFFKLSDVATIRLGFQSPPSTVFRYNGQVAVGLSVGMRKGANVLKFGEALSDVMAQVQAALPLGIEVHQVADQPKIVDEAVGHFIRALIEAVLIVLAVSFLSLGLRAGMVVATSVPLVLAITFVVMDIYGITLQRISLGALIIALGLLVDDAMISIETMISRMEHGDSRTKAASFAWTSIAMPMLSGTMITAAGFIPIAFNTSSAGEYTFSLFVVIVVALSVSWVVAVLFTPLIGVTFLPKTVKAHSAEGGRIRKLFRKSLGIAMRGRWLTIAVTVAIFAASIWSMRFVEQQFFPNSDRPELIVDLTLPRNASIDATQAEVTRLEDHLKGNANVSFWASYIGEGSPRFILSFDKLTPGPNIGQIVIQTPSVEARDALRAELQSLLQTDFPGVDGYVKLLEIGPPVGRPVQYRLSGPEINRLPDLARDLAAVLATDTRLDAVVMNWNEPARVIKVNLLQDKARQLGVTSSEIATALYQVFDGALVTEVLDADHIVDIKSRGDSETRHSMEKLFNLQISSNSGVTIPLRALATFDYATEQPEVHQRNRVPTITVKAAISTADQPDTIVAGLADKIAAFAQTLPAGYHVAVAGAVEDSAKSKAPIIAVVPIMLLVMLTLTMVQMQGFRLSFIVFCAAPLGLIGVVAALIPSGAPLGFVAILGVLALVGILIRNSIILVTEIEVLRAKGLAAWDAVFQASDSRARPILLTAAAASLALIPISRQIFWGPMAYAMMGGIIAGTLITLFFLPALYLAVFRVQRPVEDAGPPPPQ